ncbi:MAG: hypothetical protein ACOVNY_05245 [Chitinophagaceae bacterium]|jgi:hypothetical protein
MSIQLLQSSIEKEAGIQLNNHTTIQDFEITFTQYIQSLIDNHFEQLVFLLYRIDVSEASIKQLLETGDYTKAAQNIAKAIIARQQEKLAFKHQNTYTFNTDSNEEKW